MTITVKLSKRAERYFKDLIYALDTGTGKTATHSEAVNHMIEELILFEDVTGDQISGWCAEKYPKEYQHAIEESKN